MKVCGIYKITNLTNNKVYVGKSVNIWKRWQSHKDKLIKGTHFNTHLQASYTFYGLENFNCEILEECLESELNEKEKYWIVKLDSKNKDTGYNKVDGGFGGRLNPESLAKMVNSMKGKAHSEETKHKMSKSHRGVPKSVETRQKISRAKRGVPKTEEHKQKISKTLTGRKLSQEVKEKMSMTRKGVKQTILTCPHCNKQGGTTMHRWHFDKCKQK